MAGYQLSLSASGASTRLPGPLGWFEHDARLDARLLATLRKHPIDLVNWPGHGHDGPLYGIKPE